MKSLYGKKEVIFIAENIKYDLKRLLTDSGLRAFLIVG